jgi:hypothetical protein
MLPDIRPLPPVPDFPFMIDPAQVNLLFHYTLEAFHNELSKIW